MICISDPISTFFFTTPITSREYFPQEQFTLKFYFKFICFSNCSAWLRLKLNTKIGLHTHHHHPPPHKLLGSNISAVTGLTTFQAEHFWLQSCLFCKITDLISHWTNSAVTFETIGWWIFQIELPIQWNQLFHNLTSVKISNWRVQWLCSSV